MSFLKKLGSIALQVITFGAIATKDAAPVISVFNPELGALINGTMTAIITAEAAGTSAVANAPAGSNGAQKAALAITAIEPLAQAVAKQYGLAAPTQDQLQKWTDGFVAAFNALGVDLAAANASKPA